MEKNVTALGHNPTVRRGIDLEHRFFKHLSEDTKKDIFSEIMLGQSFIVSFFEDEILRAIAVFTVYADRVHIREVGGDYLWGVHNFRKYGEYQAKNLGLPYVSFVAENPTIQKRAMQNGFERCLNSQNEFIKEVL